MDSPEASAPPSPTLDPAPPAAAAVAAGAAAAPAASAEAASPATKNEPAKPKPAAAGAKAATGTKAATTSTKGTTTNAKATTNSTKTTTTGTKAPTTSAKATTASTKTATKPSTATASSTGAQPAASEKQTATRRTAATTTKAAGTAAPARAPAHISRRDTWWMLELISITIALGCTAALVIILALYQDRPLSKWPIAISINSLIAIITAIIKPAILFPVARCFLELKWIFSHTERTERDLAGFDAAARGPSGALKLFFKRFGLLAALGAVITILAVAMDPFLQEMLKYYNCPVTLDNNASVAHSNNLTSDDVSAGGPDSNRNYLNPTIRATQFQAFLNPPQNSTFLVGNVCPTGNCTFSETDGIAYSSLAVCYNLDDLISMVQPSIATDANTDPNTNYSLPSGIWVQNQVGAPLLATNTYDEKYASNATENAFFSYESLQFNSMVCTGTGGQDCNYTLLAYGVSLYPCVQTYNKSSITGGVLSEAIVTTTPLVATSGSSGTYFSIAGNFPSVGGVDCSPVDAPNGTKTVPTYASAGGPPQLSVGAQNTPSGDVQYYDPACVYFVDQTASHVLSSSAAQIFGPDNTLMNDGAGPYAPNGSVLLTQLFNYGYLTLMHSDSEGVSADDFAQGFTWAMTSVVRAGGYAWFGSTMGQQQIEDTCVTVLWPWLSLPAAIIALTLVFLACTIATATRKGYGRAKQHPTTRRQWAALKQSIWKGAGKAGADALDGGSGAHSGKAGERITEEILDMIT